MSDTTEVALDPPPPRRSRGRTAVGILAVVAVIAGAAFAAISLGGSDSNTPEDPVRAMFAAAEQGDMLGVMEELDPGERDALRGSLSDIVDELNRLDILHGASLKHLSGAEIKVKDLDLASDKVDDGLAHVRITKGTGSFDVDASKLPLGGFSKDLAGDSLKSAKSSSSDSLKSSGKTDFITTVKRGGRWYVSIGYSLAEIARVDAGKSRADLGTGVAANGTSTPEAAVRDMIMAATKLDVRRLVELLPPDELGAVQDYAALFLGQAEQGAQDAKGQFSIEIPTLELGASTSGDHATVKVTKLAISATFGELSFAYKDGCFDFTTPAASGPPTAKHLCNLTNPTALTDALGLPADLTPPKLSFTDKKVDAGIETTRVDGKWYVSPTRTSLVGLVELLRLFQPSDLTALRDYYKKAFESFSSSIACPATASAQGAPSDGLGESSCSTSVAPLTSASSGY